METSPVQITPHYLVGELTSIAAIIGAFLSYLPAIATLLAIVWYLILIFESRTFARLARHKIKEAELDARATLEMAATKAHTELRTAKVVAAVEQITPKGE